MLTELHVADLGIVAEITLVLGPGLTAITGETGAGKTLLVEALELLVGGRADARSVRDGATEARVEGRFVTGDRRRGRAGAGRARATAASAPTSTGGSQPRRGRRGRASLVDLHGQHAHQSLLAPAIQRAALDRFAGPPGDRPARRCTAPPAEMRRIDSSLAGLGGDDRARARELDLLRFQISEIDAAGHRRRQGGRALEAEEALLADALSHREALAAAYGAVEGPALDTVGAAAAALGGPRPVRDARRAAPSHAGRAGRARRTTSRVAADTVVDDPSARGRPARRKLLRELTRKYGETLADVLAYRGRGPRAAGRAREPRRPASAELERRVKPTRRRPWRPRGSCPGLDRPVPGPLPRRSRRTCASWRCRRRRSSVVVEAGELTDDGADR